MHFLLLGVDSLIACIAIGAIVDRRWRLPLAALFGVADAVGFLIGAGLGWQLSANMSAVLQTGTLVALGLYLLVVAAGARHLAVSWPVWVVPLALTLDNLTYGLVGGATSSILQQAGEQALSSAILVLIGLWAAVALSHVLPGIERRAVATRTAGGALVLAAGALALLG